VKAFIVFFWISFFAIIPSSLINSLFSFMGNFNRNVGRFKLIHIIAGFLDDTAVKAVRHISEKELSLCYLGNTFYFPSKSTIGLTIAHGIEWDSVMRTILPAVFANSITVIEIGSNIGASYVLMAHLFPDARFILAEPVNLFRSYLQKNIVRRDKIIYIESRLIDSETGLSRQITANSTTASPTYPDYGSDQRTIETSETISIDDLAQQLNLDEFDFLKVDTDGYEYHVLMGASRTIKQYEPLIFLEFSPPSLRRILNSENELTDLLFNLGCRYFLIFTPDGRYCGSATSLDEIMFLRGDDYYVDLFTTPDSSKYYSRLCECGNQLDRRYD
jgi:FkbM family methyltransferase